ncbi:BamA/TamA family outer membrane protein [Telluribacter sp. SYSU D00476]|uniref:translocation and assembly module lipoprotein TamL n=1 Tax=Telluribacter sp. SYSU D00476 TaxID=2811430 RepID=UPI001FF2B465|nr:BamA/TamA family outer membrane protein [Telluribacter sp. SYSU D00476]
MKPGIRYIFLVLTGLLLGSCSISRYIPPNESLYVGGSVKVEPDSSARAQISGLEGQLEDMLRPNPNKTLFGFPYKVWLYYVIGEPKREKGFRSWFRRKLGEPPVYASQRVVATNAQVMEAYLSNNGYFRSTARGQLVPKKNRTVEAHYTAYVKPRYFINEINFVVHDSSEFSKHLLDAKDKTLLRVNDPYRFDIIETERQRVDRYLKTHGYYYFSPDYLIMEVDSTIGDHKVNLYLQPKLTTPQTALKQYYINDIYVYTDYDALSPDTLPSQAQKRRGLYIVDQHRSFRSRIFDDAIGFQSGMQYNSEMHDVSLSRLINLRNFKFVKNRFELVPGSDSALLNVYYYLTPLPKKSLRGELSGVTKSNNLAGSQLSLTWSNRNAFRGAEQLRLSSNFGMDVQVGGGSNRNLGNDFIRFTNQGELSFPRFLIPFFRYDPVANQALPKTLLTATYETLRQKGLYTQTSSRTQWGYLWQRNKEVEHSLTPFSINLIRPTNITEAFVESIFLSENPQDVLRYLRILENRLILESLYNITYHPVPKPYTRHRFVLNGGINLAGNLAGLLVRNGNRDSDVRGQILGIPYEQFARFDGEARYYLDLSPKMRLANRFIGGLGIPYGNSLVLPQFKQYFAGGSTGIRAFRARTLGPGTYHADSITQAIFGNNSFGDIRLEVNTELRFDITSIIEGAAFVDAGNIWNYRYDVNGFYPPETTFSRDFYKQLAVGGGLGIRLDFSYLVLRLDVATPFRKPWYTNPNREEQRSPWVFDEFNVRSKAWRQENLVLNIAIGYPF